LTGNSGDRAKGLADFERGHRRGKLDGNSGDFELDETSGNTGDTEVG